MYRPTTEEFQETLNEIQNVKGDKEGLGDVKMKRRLEES